MDKSAKRDLDFLFEIGSLRNVPRGWKQHLGIDCASVLEHTLRVVWLALIIARREKGADENKVLKMALVHDMSETRVSDLSYVQKVYVKADETMAIKDMFEGTMLEDFVDYFDEADKKESLEAKIVKDADNLDLDIEMSELKNNGATVVGKWAEFRQALYEKKLYTETAKQIWRELKAADPDNWHLTMNKWLKGKDQIIQNTLE